MSDPIARLNAALEGRYRIERQLGEGGMATVYLADDLRHERKVALKVLKPELAAVVGADRFLAEIKTTAKLQHPHILPLHDSGEADRFLFYVMPFVDGESLRERLDREHQLPVDEAVQIAKNVAEALDYAHSHGVIHRDIKPANILLQAGKPVVSDFGIALAVGAAGGGRLTETGLSLGTPHYMSPEQATGDLSVGAATDIYALGCVLYEMLVGEPPYTGSTPQAVLGRIITAEVPRVRADRKSVPEHADAVVARALEKVPADRFTSAGEMARALGDPAFRYREEAAELVSRSGWRARQAIAPAALVVGLLLGWGLRGGSRPTASTPVSGNLQLVLPEGVTLPLDADYPVLAVSPDGSRIVFVGETDGRRQLYSRLLTDSVSRPIGDTDGAIDPLFSPDGASIAFATSSLRTGIFERLPLDGGALSPLIEISGEGVYRGVAWVTDTLVASVGSSNNGVWVGRAGVPGEASPPSAAAGRPLTTATLPAAWPSAVPELGDVLFGRRSATGPQQDVAVVSVEEPDGETVLVTGASSPRFSPTGHLLFARGTALYAAAYDARRRELVGPERQILAGVALSGFDVSNYAVGGNVLAYVAGGSISRESDLVWVDRSGEVVEVLPYEPRRYADPRISPDGSRISVTVTEGANIDVWLLEPGRGGAQPLTRHPGEDFEARWSPDGASLALATEVGEDTGELGPALGWIPEVGAPTEQLTFTPQDGAWEFPTSWTPDGESIVVTVRNTEERRTDVALFSLSDRTIAPLVDTPASEVGGTVSPDGRRLAYVSDESGRPEIWMRPFLRPGTPLQISNGGGREPVWSRDSRELFYRTGPDMMMVDISPGLEAEPGAPRLLFTGRFERNLFGGMAANYDVSPDGTRFLMVRRRQSVQPAVINVVLNWPDVLLPDEAVPAR